MHAIPKGRAADTVRFLRHGSQRLVGDSGGGDAFGGKLMEAAATTKQCADQGLLLRRGSGLLDAAAKALAPLSNSHLAKGVPAILRARACSPSAVRSLADQCASSAERRLCRPAGYAGRQLTRRSRSTARNCRGSTRPPLRRRCVQCTRQLFDRRPWLSRMERGSSANAQAHQAS